MNIYQRLNKARMEFHALQLKKTGHNKFAGYQYFELGDFLVPALRVFNDNGLCAVVSFDKDMATMTISNVEQAGQSITITSPLSEANLKGCHPVQNVGACETYARRYLWVAALEIVEHDALDATTGKDAKGDQSKIIAPARISAEEAGTLLSEERKHQLVVDLDEAMALAEGGKTTPLIDLFYKLDNTEKMFVWAEIPAPLRALIKKNQPEK